MKATNNKSLARHNQRVEEDPSSNVAPMTPAQVAATYESDIAKKPTWRCVENSPADNAPRLPVQTSFSADGECTDSVIKVSKKHDQRTAPTSHDCNDGYGEISTSDCRNNIEAQQETAPAAEEFPMQEISYDRREVNDHTTRIEIRPPPPSMMRRPSNESIQLSLPIVTEAHLVEDEPEAPEGPVYDAIAIRASEKSDGTNRPFWKRHRKHILLGVTSLVFGAAVATIGILVGSGSANDGPVTSARYFADKENLLCDKDSSGRSDDNLRQRFFETIEECCEVEFWHLEGNECLLKSLNMIPDDTTTPAPSTASTTKSTLPTPTTSCNDIVSVTDPTTNPNSLMAWKLQEPVILGHAANDWLGSSVASSSDGKTLAAGAPGEYDNDDRPGYVKVYRRYDNDSIWNQLGSTIFGDLDGDQFGDSVDLSESGEILAIGAPGYWNRTDRPGHVKIYSVEEDGTSSSWKQLGKILYGKANGDQFGFSVSLSSSGDIVAIGAPSNDDNGVAPGHVRVYHREGVSDWEQLGQDIIGEAAYDNSGRWVSLSGDGQTLAIGSPFNDGNGEDAGHVRVYHFHIEGTVSTWVQPGQDIDGTTAGDEFGHYVDLSNNGKVLAVGAPSDWSETDRPGYVKIYGMDDDTGFLWTQFGQTIHGQTDGDQFGVSVSLSSSGDAIAIGANANDSHGLLSGHVRVYHREVDSDWEQLGQDIEGEAAGDGSGWSVALTSDGKRVAIGSHGSESGHVRVFDLVIEEQH